MLITNTNSPVTKFVDTNLQEMQNTKSTKLLLTISALTNLFPTDAFAFSFLYIEFRLLGIKSS